MTAQLIHQNRIFSLYEEPWSPAAHIEPHPFFRMRSGSWVNIVPLTEKNEVVMVRQYRYGNQQITLEIPGGMADPEDPSPLAAAQREMREETGFDTELPVVELGSASPNPALFDNRVYSFLALRVRKVAEPTPEPWEAFTGIVLVPLAEIPQRIMSGEIDHALVISAFYFLDHYRQRESALF